MIKKYLLAQKGNDYHPHLFRRSGLIALCTLILLMFSAVSLGRLALNNTNLLALVLPNVLVDYTNQDRAANTASTSLGSLTINPVLQHAAALKANDMATKGYFAHESPDGKSPWYWFYQAGYDFIYAGENLAVNFDDSTAVNTAWMNSPGHRANILSGNFTEIGIATAQGMYDGHPATYVVELFGRPAIHKETIATSSKSIAAPRTKTAAGKPSLVTTASSTVLGAEGMNTLYTAVTDREASAPAPAVTSHAPRYSNMFGTLLSSPGKVLSVVYIIIASLLFLGIVSLTFIEYHRHHRRYVLACVGLLLLLASLFYIYHSVLFAPLRIV